MKEGLTEVKLIVALCTLIIIGFAFDYIDLSISAEEGTLIENLNDLVVEEGTSAVHTHEPILFDCQITGISEPTEYPILKWFFTDVNGSLISTRSLTFNKETKKLKLKVDDETYVFQLEKGTP